MSKLNISIAAIGTVMALSAGAPGALIAQTRATPAARIMVPAFRSTDRAVACDAANAVRSRLAGDISARTATIVPKQQIDTALQASGYGSCDQLTSLDLKALASQVSADEYVEGTIVPSPTGFHVEARYVLARDNNVTQPLPPVDAAKLTDVATALSKSIRDARRQVDDEKACYFASRQGKYDDAIKSARAAIAKFDRATMARICLLDVYQGKKASPDSVLRIAEEILAIDSLSRPALTTASQLYLARNDTANYVQSLKRMIASDPTNSLIVARVVNDLGAIGKSRDAIPVIEAALNANTGDLGLTRVAWLIYLASNEFKKALAVGEALTKADSTAFDTTFAVRMAAAATADSQPEKALEWLARGTQRFPDNAQLWLLRGQQERRLGQTQQAIESICRAMSLNPMVENGHLLLAQTFVDLQMPDSAVAAVRAAVTQPGANKQLIAAFALSLGNNLYKAGVASKAVADYEKALVVLQLADSLGAGANAKFLTGVTAFQIGITSAQRAQESKSCDLAKKAQDNFLIAQINVPAGGETNPEAAKQVLGALAQYSPSVDAQVRQLCKRR